MLLKVIAATVAAVVVARNSPTVYTLRKTDSKKKRWMHGASRHQQRYRRKIQLVYKCVIVMVT